MSVSAFNLENIDGFLSFILRLCQQVRRYSVEWQGDELESGRDRIEALLRDLSAETEQQTNDLSQDSRWSGRDTSLAPLELTAVQAHSVLLADRDRIWYYMGFMLRVIGISFFLSVQCYCFFSKKLTSKIVGVLNPSS